MLAYGVATKVLNQAVERNAERFPEDFVCRLERPELEALNRSQPVTGSREYRDPRFPPFAFTEHGAIQAANVLNSPRAVEMGVCKWLMAQPKSCAELRLTTSGRTGQQ